VRTALTLIVLSALAGLSLADEPKKPEAAKPAAAKPEAAKPETDGEAPKPDRWFAVVHGEVYTGTGSWLHDATVLAKNGAIVALGRDVQIPEGAETLDAEGRRVYPGLVAFESSGIVGNPPQDATDVYGLNMTLGLAAGITTAGAGAHVAKLTQGTLEGHTLPPHGLITLDLSNAKARQRVRQDLERVRGYLRDLAEFKAAKSRGEEAEEPDRKWLKGRLAGYEQLLNGTARARIGADGAGDLLRAAKLARHYGFLATVVGGREGWTVADELGRAGLSVVVTPRARSRPDERNARDTGWTIENAARLRQAGVDVALISGSKGIGTWGLAGSDLFTLHLEAAYAVRGGLSEEDAIAAVTLVPARLLGVDARVGSLEVGKDCDLLITSGDLLHYETLVEWAVVNGRVAYDRQQDSLLRAVRPRDLEAAQEELLPQLWPRAPDADVPAMPESERD
jgi:imidazolonepropionase-like amidohydrolase